MPRVSVGWIVHEKDTATFVSSKNTQKELLPYSTAESTSPWNSTNLAICYIYEFARLKNAEEGREKGRFIYALEDRKGQVSLLTEGCSPKAAHRRLRSISGIDRGRTRTPTSSAVTIDQREGSSRCIPVDARLYGRTPWLVKAPDPFYWSIGGPSKAH